MADGDSGRKAATPWGPAVIVEEVSIPQSGGGKEFASLVQLLEGPAGAPLVRFAYTTDGMARRGPVTLREEDVAHLRTRLRELRRLSRALPLRPR